MPHPIPSHEPPDPARHVHTKENKEAFRDSALGDAVSEKSLKDIEKGGDDIAAVPPIAPHAGQAPKDENLVGFDGPEDILNPMNWTRRKKFTVTVLYSTLTFCLTFASSVFSTATFVTAEEFHVSTEVMTLGTSLFVLVSAGSWDIPLSMADRCRDLLLDL